LIAPMRKNYVRLGIMAVGGSVWFFITTNFADLWVHSGSHLILSLNQIE